MICLHQRLQQVYITIYISSCPSFSTMKAHLCLSRPAQLSRFESFSELFFYQQYAFERKINNEHLFRLEWLKSFLFACSKPNQNSWKWCLFFWILFATGDLELLTYKAASAVHMYGSEFYYVVDARSCLEEENERDLLIFLQMHIRNSVGIYSNFQQRTNWVCGNKAWWYIYRNSSYFKHRSNKFHEHPSHSSPSTF